MTEPHADEIAALSAWRVRNAETGENITLRQFLRRRYSDDILDTELYLARQYIKIRDDDTGRMMGFSDYVQSQVNVKENPVVLYEDAGGNRSLKVITTTSPKQKSPRRIQSLKDFINLKKD